MRRIAALCLSLFWLLSFAAIGESQSAMELARRMAQDIYSMSALRQAAKIDGARDRILWTDSRINGNCSLLVYANDQEALCAAVRNASANNMVRSVGACNLYLGRCWDVRQADAYEAVLREILGAKAPEAADYILNVNTRKFHYPACSSVRSMKDKNQFLYAGEREMLLNAGYKACKRCKP